MEIEFYRSFFRLKHTNSITQRNKNEAETLKIEYSYKIDLSFLYYFLTTITTHTALDSVIDFKHRHKPYLFKILNKRTQ